MWHTFEDRRHNIVMLTRFLCKAGGQCSIITDHHHQDANIAASMWVKKVAWHDKAKAHRIRMNNAQLSLMDVEFVSGTTVNACCSIHTGDGKLTIGAGKIDILRGVWGQSWMHSEHCIFYRESKIKDSLVNRNGDGCYSKKFLQLLAAYYDRKNHCG